MAANKPLSVRMLEQRGIAHEVFAFDPAIRSAELVAEETGMPRHLVYKTIVVERDPPRGKPYLVMAPSDTELNLRALAATLGLKKLRMATRNDAERHTGLPVGGISVLALLGKGFVVFIDRRALAESHILVSAGVRGMDLRVAVTALVVLTGATPVSLA